MYNVHTVATPLSSFVDVATESVVHICFYVAIFCYSLALPVAVVYSEIIIDVLAPVVAGSDCQCQYCCCCGLS